MLAGHRIGTKKKLCKRTLDGRKHILAPVQSPSRFQPPTDQNLGERKKSTGRRVSPKHELFEKASQDFGGMGKFTGRKAGAKHSQLATRAKRGGK
jgi:hypothetical protein